MKLIGYTSDGLDWRPRHNRKVKPASSNCVYCEKPLTAETVTKEHLKPRSKGGRGCSYKSKNIKPCCIECNRERGNKTYNEYITYLYFQSGKQDADILEKKIRNAHKLKHKC